MKIGQLSIFKRAVHMVKRLFLIDVPVGVKGNVSVLHIMSHFSQGAKANGSLGNKGLQFFRKALRECA